MNKVDNIRARIIDAHTVLLGNGSEWIRISLPWIVRDLLRLVRYTYISESVPCDDRERVMALRIVLEKLNEPLKRVPDRPLATTAQFMDPREFCRSAIYVRDGDAIPVDGPIVLVCTPMQILSIETLLSGRQMDALTAIVCFSGESVIIGPALAYQNCCPICLRYLASPIVSLFSKLESDAEYMLNAGIALGRTLERRPNDIIIVTKQRVKIITHVPFVWCPQCFPTQ